MVREQREVLQAVVAAVPDEAEAEAEATPLALEMGVATAAA